MKLAVCALIVVDGKVLAVSRKDNPDDFGLPGGKVEEGEMILPALRRELYEETGLKITSTPLPIFHRMDTEYFVLTFECKVKGILKTKEKGLIKWLTWDELTAPSNTFSKYNTKLRKVYEQNCA